MPRYIIERHVGDVSEADVEEASRRSKRVIAQMDGIVWIRSYISHAEGKIYCEYEAPSEETVPGSRASRGTAGGQDRQDRLRDQLLDVRLRWLRPPTEE